MREKRVPLFLRLPEIHGTKDAEQSPPDQLRDYLSLVEDAFGAIHENIEALYHDLFIETCDDWVIPYIGDLLGSSHLSGDGWTLRADVADTIALRRRKGTLGAIELLTYNLTDWGVHCVELRENLVWNQHLNHQRPDDGGPPPYRDSRPGDPNPNMKRQTVIRGGTVTLRDPAMLALLGTPFDPFAHTADVKPPSDGSIRYNLPNLAIFLWRLAAYRVRVTRPVLKLVASTGRTAPDASRAVRFSLNPVDRPYLPADEKKRERVRLFNTNLVDIANSKRKGTDKLDNSRLAPHISLVDETPGPIPVERLTTGAPAGVPVAYVSINTYDVAVKDLGDLKLSDVGLQLHLPVDKFPDEAFPGEPGKPSLWKIRGANLCAWEVGLQPPLQEEEVAIDPLIGRMVIGVGTNDRAQALADNLLVTYTYGSVGPVGAHPISHANPKKADLFVNANVDPKALVEALKHANDGSASEPFIIEIVDSLTHRLDLNDVSLSNVVNTLDDALSPALALRRPLVIRAADNQRPIIELAQPLRFRPLKVVGSTKQEQDNLNAAMSNLTVHLEGLYLTRGADFKTKPNTPLIARAALNKLEVFNCTLDPAGYATVDENRADLLTSINLDESYGFTDSAEESAFNQIPEIILRRTITGQLLIDSVYRLDVTDSIIDAGQGVLDQTDKFAVTSATDPIAGWGPPTSVIGVTILGRMRVESIEGRGGIWVHALEVMDAQKGCIKFSYFSGEERAGKALDRLPQNHGCVKGTEAALRFKSEIFGDPSYCQLARTCDYRILEQGPNGDEMGAFGFLEEAHKWRNLQIRFREFMPVGVRPLLIPAT
ncbi:MAG TPA: hypothetical protein VKB86_16435 [Pyrinomonadaceae bacterium]|nr:hypothetical protein [Pyrinomonadaceae bacterium]